MPLDEVKRRCMAKGGSVWGNIELKLLENGTPDEVRAEVRNIMDQAKDGWACLDKTESEKRIIC